MLNCPYCQSSIPDSSAKCPVCGGDIERDDSPSCTPLEAGSVIYSKYKVERVIGQGGFGITYLAYDEKLGRKVAIKEYFPDGIASRTGNKVTMPPTLENKKNMKGFTEEARAIAKLKNPGIVDVYDIIEENGTVYIVMEYISGVPMSSLLGKIGEQDAVKYTIQTANAVKAIHAENLLHQDIKPDNIIIKDSGDIKIIDFGSSSDFADDKTRTYEKILTPGYAPLEQYGGKGRRGKFTDVYAICATLYACIKGAPPPEATALAGGVPIDFAGISSELKSIIEKGLSVKIPDRIKDTDELVGLLDDCEVKRQTHKQSLNDAGIPGGRVSENIPSSSKLVSETTPEKINEIKVKSQTHPAAQNNLYSQPPLSHSSLNNVNSSNDKENNNNRFNSSNDKENNDNNRFNGDNDKANSGGNSGSGNMYGAESAEGGKSVSKSSPDENIYSKQNFNKSNKKIGLIAVIAGVIIFIASSAAAGYFYIYLPMKNGNTINTTRSSDNNLKSKEKSAERLKAEKLKKKNKNNNKNKKNASQLKHTKYANNANNINITSNANNTGNTPSNIRVASYPPPVLRIAPPQTHISAAPRTASPENSVSAIAPQTSDVFTGQGYEDFTIAGCFYCHRIYNKGNKNGSNLTHVGLLLSYVQIKNQILHPTSSMPPSPDMPPEELSQIANWLEGLK